MRVTIQFNTDNAAFDEDEGVQGEIYRVLHTTADRILEREADFPIRDINGNTIGHCVLD